jgi:hypothetical protein
MSLTVLPFSEDDIEETFDRRDLNRGRDYWRRGAVRSLEIENDGHLLTALVQGSQRSPYEVTIIIEREESARPERFSEPTLLTECSCPVGFDCKHAAAVCLAALAKYPAPIKPVSPWRQPARDPHAAWLDDLARSTRVERIPSRDCIFYLLKQGITTPYLFIDAVKCRELKKGGYGAPQSLTPGQISNTAAQYVTPRDKLIAYLMPGCYSSWTPESYTPDEPEVYDLALREMIATGRCFLESPDTPPLKLGAEKAGGLEWQAQKDGSQTPVLVVEDAKEFLILPGMRPWYVDAAAGEAGPLRFAVPLAAVHRFAAGPPHL